VKSVFLLTPFSAEGAGAEDPDAFQAVLAGVEAAVEAAGGSLMRADDIFASGVVLDQIRAAIDGADAIVAVCTGRNANVFYELGLAAQAGHEPILVARSAQDLPFDVQHYRCQMYGGAGELESLAARLESAIRETLARSRPLRPILAPEPFALVQEGQDVAFQQGFTQALELAVEHNESVAREHWGDRSVPLLRECASVRLLSATEIVCWLAPAVEHRPEWLRRPLAALARAYARRPQAWSDGGPWARVHQTWSLLALKGLVALSLAEECWPTLGMLLGVPRPMGSDDGAPLVINEQFVWPDGYGQRRDLPVEDFHAMVQSSEMRPVLPPLLDGPEVAAGTELFLGLARCIWEARETGRTPGATGLQRPRAYAGFIDMPLAASAWAARMIEESADLAAVLGADSLDEVRTLARQEFPALVECRDATPLPWLGRSWQELLEYAR